MHSLSLTTCYAKFLIFSVCSNGTVCNENNEQSTRLYLIGTALHVADQSIHNQMYTNWKFTGSASPIVTFQYQHLWDPTLQNKCYSKIVISKHVSGKINGTRLELKHFVKI